MVAIDPDAKSGMTAVSCNNIISLLRGPDEIGSHVILSVLKGGGGGSSGRSSRSSVERCDFELKRADFRAVERVKDLYMSIAELRSAARAPKPDSLLRLADNLEASLQSLTDWTGLVEELLRSHTADLEESLVAVSP